MQPLPLTLQLRNVFARSLDPGGFRTLPAYKRPPTAYTSASVCVSSYTTRDCGRGRGGGVYLQYEDGVVVLCVLQFSETLAQSIPQYVQVQLFTEWGQGLLLALLTLFIFTSCRHKHITSQQSLLASYTAFQLVSTTQYTLVRHFSNY